MLTLKRILFPTDFSIGAEHAFEHASRLALEFDAELHVLNVMPPNKPAPEDPMDYLGLEKENLDTWSDAAHPQVSGNLKVVHARVQVTSPPEGIIYYADNHHIDLIVMSTHGRRGLDHFLVGSVAEDVVRHATCPTYTVREAVSPTRSDSIRSVLVPIDFSSASVLPVTYAKELCARRGADLKLLHVVEEAVFPTTYGVDSVAIAVPKILERSRIAMQRLVDSTPGPDVRTSTHVLIGHVAKGIVDFIDENGIDLVVMATHGHGGIERLVIGSVTEKVIRTANCPVLSLKAAARHFVAADAPEVVPVI